jgi:VCBS repeat-containing protein
VPANTFSDTDAGDTLTYSSTLSDGSALPSWLSFNPATRTFSGTPPNGDVGTVSVKVVATDGQEAAAFDVFDLSVANTNDAPVAVADSASVDENGTTANLVPLLLANDTDADAGDTRSITAVNTTGTIGSVAFNAATQSLTYSANAAAQDTLRAGQTATDSFTYTIADAAGAASTATVAVTVTGANDAPVLATPVSDQSATENLAFSFQVPVSTFSDVDAGDTLGSSATLASGAALPSWLAFDAATRTFSGTPGAGDAGSLDIRVTTTDQGGLSSSDSFVLIVAGGTLNTITGTQYGDTLIGTDAADLILGLDAHDTIDGGLGNDIIVGGVNGDDLHGGLGDDVFLVEGLDSGNDFVSGGDGFDQILGGAGDDTIGVWEYFGVDTVERIDGGAGVNVLTGSIYGDTLDFSGTALLNIARIEGGTGDDRITGSAGDDVIVGGADGDILSGGAGNDTYEVSTGDTVTEAASAGTDTVVSDITWTLGSNLENLFLTGTGAINATGNADANLVCGNAANNTLTGAAGVDALEGGAGNDTLSDSAGTDNGYFNGGAGADTLTGDSGREFFLGGVGNDTINAGSSADIIAFNKGDGQDTVSASTGQDKVLSLGGNLNYSDLAFRAVGSDLVLDTGASESLTFKNWYTGTTNKSVLTLQVIAEAMAGFNPTGGNALLDNKVESFNFQGLVNAFDTARAANPGLSSWALTNGLAQFQLSGSDTAALGGDLAYYYGLNGTLAGVGFNKAQDVLTSSQFGTQAQTLRPLATLQDGFVPLS